MMNESHAPSAFRPHGGAPRYAVQRTYARISKSTAIGRDNQPPVIHVRSLEKETSAPLDRSDPGTVHTVGERLVLGEIAHRPSGGQIRLFRLLPVIYIESLGDAVCFDPSDDAGGIFKCRRDRDRGGRYVLRGLHLAEAPITAVGGDNDLYRRRCSRCEKQV